ncbi:MAG: hypothetical protein JWM52_376 [Candidatus Saccharibacteria bacterium]|nr:hypothetical protein [Candidatus Saccharibacteria bacterium]
MSSWRSTTTGLLIGGVVIVIIASAVSFGISYFTKTTDVRFRSTVFSVKLAKDQVSQEKGLSGVTELRQNGGLLMVFDTDDTWGIWMKDMKIPLDIVWLDSNKEVIYIVKNVSPDLATTKTFKPSKVARYVLEVSAGEISKYGIKIGDKAEFDLEGKSI